jgi:hypothetical protein
MTRNDSQAPNHSTGSGPPVTKNRRASATANKAPTAFDPATPLFSPDMASRDRGVSEIPVSSRLAPAAKNGDDALTFVLEAPLSQVDPVLISPEVELGGGRGRSRELLQTRHYWLACHQICSDRPIKRGAGSEAACFFIFLIW